MASIKRTFFNGLFRIVPIILALYIIEKVIGIVKWNRLKILDIKEIDAMLLYKKFGVNARNILTDRMNISAFDTH